MKHVRSFNDFLRNTVNLNQTRIDQLDSHADAIENYGGSQCLDHETGKIRCIQTDAVGSDQSTKCSSAGVR